MKWIPITDRLPETDVEVLTLDGDTFNLATYQPGNLESEWYDNYEGLPIDTPTHWAKLKHPKDKNLLKA